MSRCWNCKKGLEFPPTIVCPVCGAGNSVEFVTDARIVRLGDPREFILHIRAEDAPSGAHVLADSLLTIMRDFGGLGLAAPQIGISTRIAVTEFDGVTRILINPRIISQSGLDILEEGCLSVPGVQLPVERATEIHVDTDGGAFDASGMEARIVQHEIDHLDGILFLDRVRAKLLEGRKTGP